MAPDAAKNVLGLLRRLSRREGDPQSDGVLLAAFVEHRDEPALTELIQRHAGMVWNVCRRLLGEGQDAEDAFQATFLVLVRKAASVREPEKVANWLYGVAQQTAVRMRALRVRQNHREKQVPTLPEPASSSPDLWNDLAPILDEELSRLPEKYRTVLVLCDLEERSRSEVARHLDCPEGTVAGRLARARTMLADRLTRRGVTTTAGSLATALAAQSASAVPAALINLTLQTVTNGTVSATVATLTHGVLQAMFLSKLKIAAIVLLSLVICATGGVLVYSATQPEPAKQPPLENVHVAARAPIPERPKTAPGFRMTATAPQLIRPDPVNLPDLACWEVKVRYRNETEKEIVLYPYVELRVFDAANKAVPTDAFLGRGIFPEDMMAEIEREFLVIPAGKTREIRIDLSNYQTGIRDIGWNFKQPGQYRVELTYSFSRAEFMKTYGGYFFTEEQVQASKRPERLWNRAVEAVQKVEVKLEVKK